MARSKRAIKWTLGLLAAVAALLGISIGSAFFRAHRLLREHLEETKAILETFPPETLKRPAIFDPVEAGNAWELEVEALRRMDPDAILNDDPPALHRFSFLTRIAYEFVESDDLERRLTAVSSNLDLLRHALRRGVVAPAKRPGTFTLSALQSTLSVLLKSARLSHEKGKELEAAEGVVLALGWAQDIARHGDLEHRKALWDAEVQGALLVRDILEAHSFSSGDLQTFALWLDRLALARPPLSRTIRVDLALERRFVVDPTFMGAMYISDGLRPTVPTWRELWSATLHDAKRASALAHASRALEGLEVNPSWQWQDLARRRLEQLALDSCQPWELPDEKSYQLEAIVQDYLTLLRVGVAVAWHHADRGTFPDTLDALPPRYLPSVPVDPYTGRPLLYEPGRIRADAVRMEKPGEKSQLPVPAEELDWKIRRAIK